MTEFDHDQDMRFTSEETNAFIDLRSYYNPTPYTIPMVSPFMLNQFARLAQLNNVLLNDDNNKKQ